MISTIINDYFGYSVATDGIWTAVGNPSSLRYTALSSSFIRTGSVEVYKYNINTDTHDLKSIISRPISNAELILLATEYPGYTASTSSLVIAPDSPLHTEYTGFVPVDSNLDILVDAGVYYTASEDGYGYSIDIKNSIMAVGNPYFSSIFNTFTTASLQFAGSGSVDIFDLSKLDIDPYAYAHPQFPTIVSSSLVGGVYQFAINVPAAQGFGFVSLEFRDTTISGSPFQVVTFFPVPNAGGNINVATTFPSGTISNYAFRLEGVLSLDPYLTTVTNPNPNTLNSFGYSVSINDEWLAVGSPLESGSKGSVFMFRKLGGPFGNAGSWSYYQTVTPPIAINSGDLFGAAVALNKASASYSGSMVIGSRRPSGSRAYGYEFDGINWINAFTLSPDNTTIYPLTFYPTLPLISGSYPNTADGFGHDVGIYRDTIIVGAPFDRHIFEYSGSSNYDQGAVYFFEKCLDPSKRYYLAKKSYGNEKTLLNNNLGISVDVYNNYAIAGCPKTFADSASICYLRGSLFQQNTCEDLFENTVSGQFILYQQITGSLPDTSNKDWSIVNVYQIKKRILQPYRDFGFSVGASESFIIVGAPFFISGSNRIMDLTPGTGSFTGSLNQISDLAGKSYIYNLKNLRPNFYVGNVFYRNGKIIIMASGSAFDGLLLPNTDSQFYDYTLGFTSKETILEKQIVCAVDIGEFNVSTNPTALILPTASFDINKNGKFDFQDADVLLKYMKYKSTEAFGHPLTDWSSSVISTNTDEELSVYTLYSHLYPSGSGALFTSSYSYINTNLFNSLDLNEDNKIDINDMNILWKYFTNRLTQKNYETYVTPSSKKKFLSQIIDLLNVKTMNGVPPDINPNFIDFQRLSKADPTGSYLAPYVTTVGLYDGTELVAVAKLGSPIKITPDFPINFIVKIDF